MIFRYDLVFIYIMNRYLIKVKINGNKISKKSKLKTQKSIRYLL